MGNHQLHVLCLGINHQSGSIALREQLAFSSHCLEASLARLGCGDDSGLSDIRELVILSTCNRVELYAATTRVCFDTLEAFLSETQHIPLAEISSHLYYRQGEEVVQHLLNVAAGLELRRFR